MKTKKVIKQLRGQMEELTAILGEDYPALDKAIGDVRDELAKINTQLIKSILGTHEKSQEGVRSLHSRINDLFARVDDLFAWTRSNQQQFKVLQNRVLLLEQAGTISASPTIHKAGCCMGPDHTGRCFTEAEYEEDFEIALNSQEDPT